MAETYSAGIVTAYGAAVRGGYTGTYEQWCQDMANLGDNVAEVRTKAAQAAQSAGNAAGSATAAETAQGKAEDAQEAAEQAQSDAEAAATNAASSATAASASATAAGNAQTAAETAQGKAEDAQEAAEQAQSDAEAAAQSVSQSAAQISQNTSDIRDLKSAKAPVIIDTASGAVASFPDGADGLPLHKLTVNIEPVQSGSGDPSPTNVRPISGWTGANVWDDPAYGGTVAWNQKANYSGISTETKNGITFTNNNDGSFTISGNADSGTGYILKNLNQENGELHPSHVLLLSANSPNVNVGVTIANYSSEAFTQSAKLWKVPASSTFSYLMLRISVAYGTSLSSAIKVTPMITDLTQMFGTAIADQAYAMEQATPGAGVAWFRNLFPKNYYSYNVGEETCVSAVNGDPYTHIPISWQSEAGTVYGGTLDVTSGVLTVDRGYAVIDGTQSLQPNGRSANTSRFYIDISGKAAGLTNIISDRFMADGEDKVGNMSGRAAFNGVEFSLPLDVAQTATAGQAWFSANPTQLVYELATPIEITLTPTQIDTLLGTNNVWADCGNVTVDYPADTKLFIQKVNKPTDDDMTADTQIASGKYFIVGNNLYLSTTTIPAGDTIIPGTNCTKTNFAEALNALNT